MKRIALTLLLLSTPAAADDPIYLRCIYTDEAPIMRQGGRHVILTINVAAKTLRFDDHYQGGTTSDEYAIVQDAKRQVIASLDGKNGVQKITLDRTSGRAILAHDSTDNADRLWNDEKQRIGGFDLSGGKRLWLTTTLDCKPTRPLF